MGSRSPWFLKWLAVGALVLITVGACGSEEYENFTRRPGTVLVITTPVPRDPPYPLPTPEPGCSWTIVRGPLEGDDQGTYILNNSCYHGDFLFIERTGQLGVARGVRDEVIRCDLVPYDPVCRALQQERELLTQRAIAGGAR